ncbi:alpha/beta fold hydrolase [Streptomyces bobili]|uniref:alpha/beta fold hydrolase n=1 Tax=Streptomyces bobili TaxID=67280 RepID=UPI0037BD1C2B
MLLHGLAGHAGEWDVLSGRLSSQYRVVALDQRGHGASERHPRDVCRAAYVADVIAVVEQLALQRPVLVGQSLGGHTAMLTAAAHPGLVRALVLVEAGPGGPNPDGPADIGGWLDSWPTPFPSREAERRLGGRAGGTRGRMVASLRPGRDGPLAGGERPAFLSARVGAGRVPDPGRSGPIQLRPCAGSRRDAPAATRHHGHDHPRHWPRPAPGQPEILHTALSDFLGGLA